VEEQHNKYIISEFKKSFQKALFLLVLISALKLRFYTIAKVPNLGSLNRLN